MKAKILITALFMSLFSLLSLAQLPANMTPSQKTDGQILEKLVVINTNEINAANEALKKTSNANVKQFAQTMVDDHSKNLQDTQQLASTLNLTLLSSDKSTDLQKEGKKELAKLTSLSDKDFDKEYIDAMIKDHEKALKILDSAISKASNPKVVDHLKATRTTVAHHLEMAKETQKMLQ